MRIVVGTSIEAGSCRAHAINVVKTAEGFAALGHRVSVFWRRPDGGAVASEELDRRYGVTRGVTYVQLPRRVFRLDLGPDYRHGKAAAWLARLRGADFVYARDFHFPAYTARLGIPTVAESHAHPDNRSIGLARFVEASRLPYLLGLVTIGDVLVDHFAGRGVPREKIKVVPDGVDLRLFERPASPPASPYRGSGPHVTYAGHLYDYKGIPTVLDAAAVLPAVSFHLVGGTEEDLARQRAAVADRGLVNVTLHGRVDHGEVPRYLWHADALLLPPSADHPSARWTSPVKLGEYLASGTPVIASDIPALQRWVNEHSVSFFRADTPASLAAAIRDALERPVAAQCRAAHGVRLAQTFSYERRARAILAFHADPARRQAA